METISARHNCGSYIGYPWDSFNFLASLINGNSVSRSLESVQIASSF